MLQAPEGSAIPPGCPPPAPCQPAETDTCEEFRGSPTPGTRKTRPGFPHDACRRAQPPSAVHALSPRLGWPPQMPSSQTNGPHPPVDRGAEACTRPTRGMPCNERTPHGVSSSLSLRITPAAQPEPYAFLRCGRTCGTIRPRMRSAGEQVGGRDELTLCPPPGVPRADSDEPHPFSSVLAKAL